MKTFLELLRDIWEFLKVRKKILASSAYYHNCFDGSIIGVYARNSSRPIHIFNILI